MDGNKKFSEMMKIKESDISKERLIWEEVIEDNALDNYIQSGGSMWGIIRRVQHDICKHYCKYHDAIITSDDGEEYPEECENCPLDMLYQP